MPYAFLRFPTPHTYRSSFNTSRRIPLITLLIHSLLSQVIFLHGLISQAFYFNANNYIELSLTYNKSYTYIMYSMINLKNVYSLVFITTIKIINIHQPHKFSIVLLYSFLDTFLHSTYLKQRF
jgi:hypothetical protein